MPGIDARAGVHRRVWLGLAAAESAGVPSAVGFGHTTPDSIGFVVAQSVVPALGEDGAVLADLSGARFASGPGVAAFSVGGEEDRRFDAAARGAALPTAWAGEDLVGRCRWIRVVRGHCGSFRPERWNCEQIRTPGKLILMSFVYFFPVTPRVR